MTVAEHVAGYRARGVLAQLAFAVEHRVDRSGHDCVYVTLDVPDTDDESRSFTIWAMHRIAAPQGPAEVDQAVRAALLECWDHEVGECVLHGEALPLYPHGRSRRVPEGSCS